MKAVILAGGLGTRISEETDLKPKPMISIGGMPILWHIMKMYSHHGINEFIVCCGYKGYVIKEYFANYFLHMSDVTFDMSENLFLGKEVARKGISRLFGILDRKEMRRQALQAIQEFNAKFPDVNAKVETMSGGQRQIVAMTRGAFWGKSLLLLDEPTAALGVQESKSVLEVIERFRSQKQMSLLIISHNLEHVWQVCDRILVLRGGNLVANLIKNDVTKSDVVSHITGAYSK